MDADKPNWTMVTLETYLSARIAALRDLVDLNDAHIKERFLAAEKALNLAFADADRALNKAEINSDKRFDKVNEFRAALADQTLSLMPRAEYRVEHASMAEKLNRQVSRLDALESIAQGRTQNISSIRAIGYGVIITISALAAVGAVIVAIVK